MKKIISFTRDQFDYLKKHLFRGENADEEAVFLICGISESRKKINVLIRDIVVVPDSAFLSKGKTGLRINPDFISKVLKKCRLEGLSIVMAHSHPFSRSEVRFSGIDDYGENILFPKIQSRVPNQHHAAMVFGQSSLDARIWLRGESRSECIDQVKVIGNHIDIYSPTSSGNIFSTKTEELYNRQILAFKEEGQKKIEGVKVGIVGLGGIGSQVFQQLAHLGVRELILVDPDNIEESNHNRIVGLTKKDIEMKRPKVEIMKCLGTRINPKIKLYIIQNNICDRSVVQQLKDADVVFGCTDNMSSRIKLTRISPQYFIPVIDLGIDIQQTNNGKIRSIGGHIVTVYPDGPCLDCLGFINHDQLNWEISQNHGKIRNPYIQGDDNHSPSIISLNGVIASLAVTNLIHLITGCFNGQEVRVYQIYDGVKGVVRRVNMKSVRNCKVCTEVRALGDNAI